MAYVCITHMIIWLVRTNKVIYKLIDHSTNDLLNRLTSVCISYIYV